ncbi:MAG: LysM peptidoglycan-binding domain-containing protein, partial [Anaerolineales bacterium]
MSKRLPLFVIVLLFLSPLAAKAQQGSAVYIVQPGDTLFTIAARFSLSPQAIIEANRLTNPNFLQVGQRLILPGLDIQGTLTTISVPPGATFETLARQYHIDIPALRRVNRLLLPDQVYIGQNLIIIQEMVEQAPLGTFPLQSGESWFEAAVRQGANPWSLLTLN